MRVILVWLLTYVSIPLLAQRYIPPQCDCSPEARYNDSLFIYNTYASQIEMLKNVKESDIQNWRDRQAHDDAVIACKLICLKQCNGIDYLPDDEYNREGIGTGLHYPAPSLMKHAGVFVPNTYSFRYSIIDVQTHFMSDPTDSTGKRKIPYIIRYLYDHGRVIQVQKLNPVTYAVIE